VGSLPRFEVTESLTLGSEGNCLCKKLGGSRLSDFMRRQGVLEDGAESNGKCKSERDGPI